MALLCLGTLFLRIGDVAAAKTPCPLVESVDISNGVENADGSIELDGVRYGSNQYFRDANSTVRGCVCLVRQCLHICCPMGSPEGEPCPPVALNVNFSMTPAGTVHDVRNLLDSPNYHLLYFNPECSGALLTLYGDEYIVRSVGDVAKRLKFRFRSCNMQTLSDTCSLLLSGRIAGVRCVDVRLSALLLAGRRTDRTRRLLRNGGCTRDASHVLDR